MDNESLPVGTTIEQWINDEEFQGGVWAFINIDLSQNRVRQNALTSLCQSVF